MPNPNRRESEQDKQKPKDAAGPLREYARYSALAVQMGLIILAGAFIGKKLDERFQFQRPYLTVVFSLFAISAALYLSLKDLFRGK